MHFMLLFFLQGNLTMKPTFISNSLLQALQRQTLQ